MYISNQQTNLYLKKLVMEIDTGLDKSLGLHTIIEHLRNEKGQDALHLLNKIRKVTFKKFMRTHTLLEAASHGFLPIDCLSENISWEHLRGRYGIKEILNWGMTFDVALQMGLQPKHIGGNDGLKVLLEIGATAADIKNFLTTFHDIAEAKWEPQICKEAGFSFMDIVSMGGNSKTMHRLKENNWNIKTIVLAFDPDANEWLEAGFNDKCVSLWNSTNYRNFVAAKTSLVVPNTNVVDNDFSNNEMKYKPSTTTATITNNIIGQPKFVALNL